MKFIYILLLCLLTSCNNFNTIKYCDNKNKCLDKRDVTEPPIIQPKVTNNHEVDTNTYFKTNNKCDFFDLPPIPKTPPLPLESIDKIQKDDLSSLNKIEVAHITELREYIFDLKKSIRQAYEEYIVTCREENK